MVNHAWWSTHHMTHSGLAARILSLVLESAAQLCVHVCVVGSLQGLFVYLCEVWGVCEVWGGVLTSTCRMTHLDLHSCGRLVIEWVHSLAYQSYLIEYPVRGRDRGHDISPTTHTHPRIFLKSVCMGSMFSLAVGGTHHWELGVAISHLPPP